MAEDPGPGAGSGSGSESEPEEYLGMEQPPLIRQLKTILSDYPDDGQIIKELIQNAEDAGAATLKILYDGRALSPELDKKKHIQLFFQGPALCFYNDAYFSEDDWKGIRTIYSSIKEDDPLKVGRFGLGFKSVFHITDFPWIISGKYVLFMNPLQRNPNMVCTRVKLSDLRRSKRLNYADLEHCLQDLLRSLGLAENTLESGYCKGTIFRFPLRREESDLSETLYDQQKVMDLFTSFQSEAPTILLFLKSLTSIELFFHKSESELSANRSFFEVALDGDGQSLQEQRISFKEKVVEASKTKTSSPIILSSYLVVQTTQRANDIELPQVAQRKWLVVHFYMGRGMSKTLKKLVEDKTLCYSPNVGIAFPLDQEQDDFVGHVFCFLPLPQESKSLTGLPVHVNGSFALSQNRRYLKWSSADQEKFKLHTDKAIEWNNCLLREILPKAYAVLIKALRENSTQPTEAEIDRFFSCLPDVRSVDNKWRPLVDELYRLLLEGKFIYTENAGGKWIKYPEARFVVRQQGGRQGSTFSLLKEVLLLYNENFAELTSKLRHVFKTYSPKGNPPRVIDSTFVAGLLRKNNVYEEQLSSDQKLLLLEYLTDKIENVKGLKLLPLDNGTFTRFEERAHTSTEVYLHDDKTGTIFPEQGHRFLLRDGPPGIQRLFEELAKSETYQLRRISDNSFAYLLAATLSVREMDTPTNIPKGKQVLPWLEKVWVYILSRFPHQLSTFKHLPILPNLSSSAPTLHCLSERMIMKKMPSLQEGTEGSCLCLPESVCTALASMSVVVISSLPTWIKFSSVETFVFRPTVKNVLKLFADFTGSASDICVPNDETKRTEFVKFMSRGTQTELKTAKHILSQLRIFRQAERPGSLKLVALSENSKLFKEETVFPVPFPEPHVIVREEELRVTRNLNATEVTEREMILNVITALVRLPGKYDKEERNAFMLYLLPLLTEGLRNDDEIIQKAKHVEFLQKKNGQYCKAIDVFDETDAILRDMFIDEDVFAVDKVFYGEGYIDALRKLGLKTGADVKAKDILAVARSLDKIETSCNDKIRIERKAIAFVTMLDHLAKKPEICTKKNKPLSELVGGLKCIFVVNEKPRDYPDILPWHAIETFLCRPVDVKSYKFVRLIGSVTPLVNCDMFPNVSKLFGWSEKPTVAKIFQQLEVVISKYQNRERPTLLNMIFSLYQTLAKHRLQDVRLKLKKKAKEFAFIWNGNGFCPPDRVYLKRSKEDIELSPYIVPLPEDFEEFSSFFTGIGCFEAQNNDVLLYTQGLISSKYEHQESVEEDFERDLGIILSILRKISKTEPKPDEVLLPVYTGSPSRLILRPARECTYCEAESLEDVEFEESDDILYVHESVPESLAKTLGATSLRECALNLADADDWVLENERFEQDEPLTTRISSLLKSYTDGLSVPKELIQNADDAGASEIKFLFDERENQDARTHLLSQEFAECQGPALWVYNNRRFTEEDMKNIKKLNGATKEMDENKVGKFGLGFCSVYNLTDVPTFVSGEYAVIFDPNMIYLPGNKKGTRINLDRMNKMKMMKRIKNQFKTFEGVFGCHILSTEKEVFFEGTLFRLPLRTETQAKDSKISNKAYPRKEMEILLKMFMETAGSFLFFTQNVQTIELYHLKTYQNPEDMECIYFVKRSHLGQPPSNPVLHEVSNLKKQRKLKTLPLTRNERVAIEIKAEASEFQEESVHTKSQWIISWASGSSQSAEMALANNPKGAVPLGSIAVPLESAGDFSIVPLPLDKTVFGFYKKGHIFCFLPLPIETEIQVHLNGSFSVTDDRRHLRVRTSDDKISIESVWNEVLLNDAVCKAFLSALEFIRDKHPKEKYRFYQLWPCQTEGPCVTTALQTAFYNDLVKHNYKLFERNGCWVGLTNCIFLDHSLKRIFGIGKLVFDALTRLVENTDLEVIDLPDNILSILFTHHKDALKIVTEKSFFEEYFFPNFNSPTWKTFEFERNQLTLYALDAYQNYSEYLKLTECIPTSYKSTFKQPSEIVDPNSKAADMYFIEDDVFPEKEFCAEKVLKALRKIGMQGNKLSQEYLIERARQIGRLSTDCCDCAQHLCSEFVSYLALIQLDLPLIQQLQKIAFLPLMKKPKAWPFRWESESLQQDHLGLCNVCARRKYNGDTVHNDNVVTHLILSPPQKLYFQCHANVVGCTGLLLDEHVFHNERMVRRVFEKLGVKSAINDDVIITQLLQVACFSGELDKDMMSRREIVCNEIYYALEKSCEKGSIADKLEDLFDVPVILLGQELVCPKQVAFSLKHNCSPHLFGLDNSTLLINKCWLKAVGVKKAFSTEDILSVLEYHKKKWQDNIVPDEELYIIVNLLLAFHDAVKCENLDPGEIASRIKRKLFLPDKNKKLQSIDMLCMEDDQVITDEEMCVINPLISKEIAETLGVKTKKRQQLMTFSNPIKMPFGQHEKLVTRLKRILDGYPSDVAILKELLQNADDAGATEIEFIKDFTCHETENIFDKSFEPLQGPALCVFNNSSFTEVDLEGIQSLGVGSKADDPTKTGQYGVGFNAVYHLTDAPSFLSKGPDIRNGATLCFLDPMCKYIPEATEIAPGLRIHDLEKIRLTDSDVFAGYHESTYMNSAKGTIFRLPLRTKEFAQTSEISPHAFTPEKVDELLESFKGEMADALLFVKNITKISIVDITKGKRKEEFTISANLSKESSEKRRRFWNFYGSVSQRFHAEPVSVLKTKCEEIEYDMEVHSNEDSKKWVIVHRLGFGPDDALLESVKRSYDERILGLLPHGAVAVPLPKMEEKRISQLSKEQRKEQEAKNDKKAFCFLPLPIETRLPVHVHGYFALDSENRRNLFFAKSGGYKSDWNRCLIQYVISRAYIRGIQAVKKELFSGLDTDKESIWSRMNDRNNVYHSYFPSYDKAKDDIWKFLVTCVFQTVYKEEADIFPVIKETEKRFSVEWLAIRRHNESFPAYFNEILHQIERFRKENKMYDKTFADALQPCLKACYTAGSGSQQLVWELEKSLRAVGVKLVSSPMSIHKSMKDASIEVEVMTAEAAIRFLKSHANVSKGCCKLGGLNIHISKTNLKTEHAVRCLLYYCSIGNYLGKDMDNVPLLVTEDYFLRVYRDSDGVFCSQFCKLLPGSKEKFILYEHLPFLLPFHSENPALCELTLEEVVKMIPKSLPPSFYNKTGSMSWYPDRKDIPNKEWMELLWLFLYKTLKEESSRNVLSDQSIRKLKNAVQKGSEPARLQQRLNGLMPWSIVPASLKRQNEIVPVLIPLKEAFTAVVLYSFSCEEKMKTSIEKMQLPQLDVRFSKVRDMFFRSLFADKDHPLQMLQCLNFHEDHIKAHDLSADDCLVVLGFFNSCLQFLRKEEQDTTNLKKMLRKIPLYVTVQGTHQNLERCGHIFVLPSDFPSAGIEFWAKATKTVLLVENSTTEDLYKFVGCDVESEIDIYIRYILPTFKNIPVENQMDHLVHFKNNLLLRPGPIETLDKKQKQLVDLLKTLYFIHTEDGHIKRADQFYSPHEPIFKQFLNETNFPPPPFSSVEWKEFMELIGMRTVVSEDLVIRFVEQLAEEAKNGINETYTERVKCIMARVFDDFSKSLLNRIKGIEFIPPLRVAPKYQSVHTQLNVSVCAFQGSTQKKHLKLTWTTCSILPKSADPNLYPLKRGETKLWLKELGISSPPDFDCVLMHIRNVCKLLSSLSEGNLETKRTLFGTATEVLNRFYEYLSNNKSEVEAVRDTLRDLPLIYFEEQRILVPPSRVVLELTPEDEIKPYLHKFPIRYGQYFELFHNLGCEKRPSAKHFCFILEQIRCESGGNELHVEELRFVKRALDGLLNLWSGCRENTQDTSSVQCLHLPDEKRMMVDSKKLVIADNQDYKSRIAHITGLQFFIGFRELELDVPNVIEAISNIPENVRPKLLSEIVSDEIDLTTVVEVQPSNFKRTIEHFLRSPEVLQGLIRLVLNERTSADLKSIQENLQNIEVTEVEHLQRRLTFQGSVLPNSTTSTEVFLHTTKTPTKKWNLFFKKHRDLRSLMNIINKSLMDVLQQCAGIEKMQLHLITIVHCIENPESIARKLDQEKIRAYSLDEKFFDSVFPDPGTFVPEGVHDLLQQGFSIFQIGEYAAFETYDPALEENFQFSEQNEAPPVFIYVRVLEVKETSSEVQRFRREYVVDVGNARKITVEGYRLYKFTRERLVEQGDSLELVYLRADGATAEEKAMPTLREALKSVRKILKEAWKEPEHKKKAVIKRLMLEWHPDKNIGHEEMCTKVFQYIQHIIQKLKKGEPVGEEDDEDFVPSKETNFKSQPFYSDLFEEIYRRGRSHGRKRNGRRKNRRERGNHFQYFREETTNLPGEYRRWLRQARADLSAAQTFLRSVCDREDHYNWICYMSYQASEKGLKALWFVKDANNVPNCHDLVTIAAELDSDELMDLARQMMRTVGSDRRLRYPDVLNGMSNPSELYTRNLAVTACEIAEKLLDIVSRR